MSKLTDLNGWELLIVVALLVCLVAMVCAAIAGVFMLIWNVTIHAVFNGPEITYMQALGLWLLIGFVKGHLSFKVSS